VEQPEEQTTFHYRPALKICTALGVVQDALRDLEMVRTADIEGLELVFELKSTGEKENG
jgi:sporulation-control protein spo0M